MKPVAVWLVLITAVLAGVAHAHGVPREQLVCEKCGDPIVDSYFETNGNYYHSGCFSCEYCGKAIKGAYTTFREKNYHTTCFESSVAKRCSLCNGVVEGEYLLDFWGNAYHLSHRDETQACSYCGRFIAPHLTGGGVRYSDGRYICNLCRESAVTEKSEALTIMTEVARYLRFYGMNVGLGEIELHVVGLRAMQHKSGKGSHRLTGFTEFEESKSLFGITASRRIDVYLLYGMPRIDVVSTLAHELAHVWQFSAGRLDNDKAFAEGSCNYASYLVLQHYRGKKAEYLVDNLIKDESRIYGYGFRRVKRFAETEGINVWLERLEKKNDLPSGY
jgi:hypothetical protein